MGTSGDQAGLSPWLSGQRNHLQCRRHMSFEFDPWVEKTPWRRKWQPTPVFLPGESMDRGAWWLWLEQLCLHRNYFIVFGKRAGWLAQVTQSRGGGILLLSDRAGRVGIDGCPQLWACIPVRTMPPVEGDPPYPHGPGKASGTQACCLTAQAWAPHRGKWSAPVDGGWAGLVSPQGWLGCACWR